jgi:hypothetical protein
LAHKVTLPSFSAAFVVVAGKRSRELMRCLNVGEIKLLPGNLKEKTEILKIFDFVKFVERKILVFARNIFFCSNL